MLKIKNYNLLLFILTVLMILLFISTTAFDYYQAGLKLEEQKKYFEAIEYYQNAIDKNSNYFDAYFHLGLCYFYLNRINEANNVFEKAYFLNKDNIQLIYYLATVKEKLKDYENSLKYIKKIKELKPTFLDAYYLEALIFLDQGFPDQALRIYKNIYEKYPSDWKVNLNIYKFYKNIGRIDEGIQYLQNALNINSHEPLIYQELILYYYYQGKYDKTEEYLDKLYSIDKNNPVGLMISGSILFKEGNFKDAISYFYKLYELEPEKRDNLWILANLYFLNNQIDLSMKFIKKGLDHYPQDEVFRFFIEEISLQDRQKNETLLNKLAEFEFKWGKYFYTNGYEDYALSFLRRAVKLTPFNPNYRYFMSEVYKNKKMYFLQRDEYNLLKDLNYPQIDIKLQIINHYLQNTLEEKYNFPPYQLEKKSILTVGIFTLNNKDNIISYFEKKELIKFLYSRMKNLHRINIVKSDQDFATLDQIANYCKSNNIDIILLVKPVGSYSVLETHIDFELINPKNLIIIEKFNLFSNSDFPLNEIVYDLSGILNKKIPLRGKLIDLEGSIGIINLGRVHGINKDTVIKIVSKKDLELKFDSLNLDYDDNDIVATCKIMESSETITRVLINKKDYYSKVQLGYYVVFEKSEEEKGKNQ